MSEQLLRLAAGDDVAIAHEALPAHLSVGVTGGGRVVTEGPVPRGHKVALRDLAPGDLVLKYGHVIGVATAPVRAGRSEEHTSELQSRQYLVCRLLLEKKKKK